MGVRHIYEVSDFDCNEVRIGNCEYSIALGDEDGLCVFGFFDIDLVRRQLNEADRYETDWPQSGLSAGNSRCELAESQPLRQNNKGLRGTFYLFAERASRGRCLVLCVSY